MDGFSSRRRSGRPYLSVSSRPRLQPEHDHFSVVVEGCNHRRVVCLDENKRYSKSNPDRNDKIKVSKQPLNVHQSIIRCICAKRKLPHAEKNGTPRLSFGKRLIKIHILICVSISLACSLFYSV